MRIAILRRAPKASVSMDVYADGLAEGLRAVRPDWTIEEHCPDFRSSRSGLLQRFDSVAKYYERYWRYPTRIRKLDADIFHIIDHSDGYLSGWLHRAQRPNVVTCHDLINLIRPETFKGRAQFPLISMTAWRWGVEGMRRADHVISVSAHTKQDVIEQLGIPPQSISVIYNAVDSVFRRLPPGEVQAARHQYGLTPKSFCLLNVGSNNARKNISAVLAAVEKLKNNGVPIHFWKVGADFNAEQKQFIHSKGLTSCVAYLGQPDEATLVRLYNAADCLMAPSLYEGFGLTLLEAMACGTAVITGNVSAMPEVVGEAAILADPVDVEAIARAAQRLYEHPDERNELSRLGLKRVQRFTWKDTAEQAAQIYEKVLRATPLAAAARAPKFRENHPIKLQSPINSQGEP
ncbi:MAG: glycosyltransferase family 1 protein [Elainellaceae cyanobacterium]